MYFFYHYLDFTSNKYKNISHRIIAQENMFPAQENYTEKCVSCSGKLHKKTGFLFRKKKILTQERPLLCTGNFVFHTQD